jgi:ATP-dependent DNA helicase RecQ
VTESADEQALFEELRALRLRLARERGVPPYVIFHDATLRELAHARPTSAIQLLDVPGIGERKAAVYGAAVLEAIAAWQTRPT